MGVIVPNELQRGCLIPGGDQRQLGIFLERPGKVAHLAVDARRQRRFGKPRPDRSGHVGGRRSRFDLADRPVRKADLEHLRHGRFAHRRGCLAVKLNAGLATRRFFHT
jgi:hypothetical protein